MGGEIFLDLIGGIWFNINVMRQINRKDTAKGRGSILLLHCFMQYGVSKGANWWWPVGEYPAGER